MWLLSLLSNPPLCHGKRQDGTCLLCFYCMRTSGAGKPSRDSPRVQAHREGAFSPQIPSAVSRFRAPRQAFSEQHATLARDQWPDFPGTDLPVPGTWLRPGRKSKPGMLMSNGPFLSLRCDSWSTRIWEDEFSHLQDFGAVSGPLGERGVDWSFFPQ